MQHLGKVMARKNAGAITQQSINLYCGFGCNPFGGSLPTPQFLNIGSAPTRGGSAFGGAGIPCTDPGLCGGTVYWHGNDTLKFSSMFYGSNLGKGQWWRSKSAPSWEGERLIDPVDFEILQSKIGEDVNKTPGIWLIPGSMMYDTPFYNLGERSGLGCFGVKCYDRSQINYIGEGAAWAQIGVPKFVGHFIIVAWKKIRYPYSLFSDRDYTAEFEMFDKGYDYQTYNYISPANLWPGYEMPFDAPIPEY